MKQKELAAALRGIVLLGLVCVLVLALFVLPSVAADVRREYPEYARLYWPCLGGVWATALPVFAALLLVWRIAGDIGRDRSFCPENARRLKGVCALALIDTAAYIAGAVALAALGLLHPSILLLICGVTACGLAIAVIAAAASHLVYKAAALKAESDLTI